MFNWKKNAIYGTVEDIDKSSLYDSVMIEVTFSSATMASKYVPSTEGETKLPPLSVAVRKIRR